MIDPDEAAELRRADTAQRKRDAAANAHVWNRRTFDDQFPDCEDWPNANQPKCTAAGNGAIAARKAIALAQERTKNKEQA